MTIQQIKDYVGVPALDLKPTEKDNTLFTAWIPEKRWSILIGIDVINSISANPNANNVTLIKTGSFIGQKTNEPYDRYMIIPFDDKTGITI